MSRTLSVHFPSSFFLGIIVMTAFRHEGKEASVRNASLIRVVRSSRRGPGSSIKSLMMLDCNAIIAWGFLALGALEYGLKFLNSCIPHQPSQVLESMPFALRLYIFFHH